MEDFDKHIRYMEGFHRRYMVSNNVLRFWANMVKEEKEDSSERQWEGSGV